MSARIIWSGGGEGEVLVLEGDRAELRSSVPFAPGSRPAGHLLLSELLTESSSKPASPSEPGLPEPATPDAAPHVAPDAAPDAAPRSSSSPAPGRPTLPIWLKVHRSRREIDGSYQVWGRLLNVTRELRVALVERIPAQAPPRPESAKPAPAVGSASSRPSGPLAETNPSTSAPQSSRIRGKKESPP